MINKPAANLKPPKTKHSIDTTSPFPKSLKSSPRSLYSASNLHQFISSQKSEKRTDRKLRSLRNAVLACGRPIMTTAGAAGRSPSTILYTTTAAAAAAKDS